MTTNGSSSIYCFDTSSLVALQQSYPPAIFPDLWEQLGAMAGGGELLAPREVFNELRWGGDDDLRAWAEAHRFLFIDPDSDQLSLVREIVNDRTFLGLVDVDAELPDADPFVVALAVVQNRKTPGSMVPQEWVVVTDQDGAKPGDRPNIHAVCGHPGYAVRVIAARDMLMEQGIHLPPSERGLADLYGLWQGVDISEQDIEEAKLRAREL